VRRAVITLAVALVAWSGAVDACASGVPRLYFNDRARSPVLTDGERWAAYQRLDYGIRVIDTLRRTSFAIPPERNCQLGAVGRSELLMRCNDSDDLRLVNLFTHVAHAPVGGASASTAGSARGVGRYWLDLGGRQYLNWRTGSFVAPADDPGTFEDLDSPGLHVRMCVPLLRQRIDEDPYYSSPPFDDYAYRYPFGATVLSTGPPALLLDHCGFRPVARFRCPRYCFNVQLGGGALTWTQRPPLIGRVYLLRTHRGFSLPLAAQATIAHTRYRVYRSDLGYEGSYSRLDDIWNISSAAWAT
jgi:hypothetical protein